MMEERTPVTQPSSDRRAAHRGSYGWLAFWLIVFMLIGFGGVGLYLDNRLSSLEEKVLSQTSDVSKQTESTLQALQSTQREVLGNRQETAAFAQKFTNTLDEMSSLLTQTFDAFSKQTVQLTKAIEKKEESQSQSLETAIADLTHEIASTRDAALQAKSKAEAVDRQLALLGGQLQQINDNLSNGLTTLTQYSQEMSATINARMDRQKENLGKQLAELRDASSRSLEIVKEKIASLDGKVDRAGQQIDERSKSMENSLARHIDGVGDRVQAGLYEQAAIASTEKEQLQQSEKMAESLSLVEGRLDSLSGSVEIGFAAGEEGREAIRADLLDTSYNLNGRTEDLLVELIGLKQTSGESQVYDKLNQFENRFDLLTQNLQVMQSEIGAQMEEAARGAMTAGIRSLEVRSDEKLVQTATELKRLEAQVQGLHSSVQNSIDSTRNKAAKLIEDPQSEDARNAFESELLEFTNMIQSTRSQMEHIQKQISSMAIKLSQIPNEAVVDSGKPIGMAVETSQ